MNTMGSMDSISITIVMSFGINPVRGGSPPKDSRRVMTAKWSTKFLDEILFICLIE